jgi:transposase
MSLSLDNLPDDTSKHKEFFLSFFQELEKQHHRQEQKYQEQINYLEEKVRLLQNELFGRKTEKTIVDPPNQVPLFESSKTNEHPEPNPSDDDRVVIPEHSRRKRGRKPLPEDLPRIEVVHDISEDDKQCECGTELSRIGEDVCEKLDYVPAKIRVIRHIRPKYACKSCEGVESDGPTVKIAPPAIQLIPKSIATEGLLAHLIVSKFADALPLYRQQKIFGRLGIELSRSTMAGWVIAAYRECMPLTNLLSNEIRGGPLINIDETPLQVMKEPGRANAAKSYMWVFKGGSLKHPALLYRYHPTRSGDVALQFLVDYEGYVQSDAYSGYDRLSNTGAIRHVGCWAHARRCFVEVIKAKKKNRSKRASPKSLADEALEFIGRLYQIEKEGKYLDPDQLYRLRQEKSKPVLDQFKAWLGETQPITPPKGLLGKAIQYALNHWDKLIVYIEDGRLKPDNNDAENAIRPFVVGRKNWLFAGHPNGAEAAATFFSLIETAKANGLEPYAYLRYVFERLPLAETIDDYEMLMPRRITKSDLELAAAQWA